MKGLLIPPCTPYQPVFLLIPGRCYKKEYKSKVTRAEMIFNVHYKAARFPPPHWPVSYLLLL